LILVTKTSPGFDVDALDIEAEFILIFFESSQRMENSISFLPYVARFYHLTSEYLE
jgi:hypothetical protein